MCYNQTGDISTLDGTSLKLVDKFTYLGSSVSSIDYRSYGNQTWPQFLLGSGRVDTAIWMHYLDANKTAGEEARRQLHENVASNIEQVLAATPQEAPTIRLPTFHHENYPS